MKNVTWRPATNWVLLAGLFYQVIVEPLLRGFFPGHFDSGMDIATIAGNVAGILGMAGLRTIEKVKGVTK